jgi:Lar family restriction alleviation protein
MKTPKLKPCPFCGHDAESFSVVEGEWQIACLDYTTCELTPVTWAYKTKVEAIAAWNRRRA